MPDMTPERGESLRRKLADLEDAYGPVIRQARKTPGCTLSQSRRLSRPAISWSLRPAERAWVWEMVPAWRRRWVRTRSFTRELSGRDPHSCRSRGRRPSPPRR